MKIARVAYNAITAKLLNPEPEICDLVFNILSYKVKGYEMTDKYKTGAWDGMSTFFNYRQATFPAGFVTPVCNALRKHGYEIQITTKELPPPLFVGKPAVDKFPEEERYAYQWETVEKLLTYGRMIAQIATGGGKSRIAKLATKKIGRKTIFITTRSVLMYQMKKHFEDMGEKVGVIGDDIFAPEDGVNVAMIQTLASHLKTTTFKEEVARLLDLEKNKIAKQIETKRKELDSVANRGTISKKDAIIELSKFKEHLNKLRKSDKQITIEANENIINQSKKSKKISDLLETFEFVIAEEAHESSGNDYFTVMQCCKNAYWRLALTATPFMKDDEESNMRLMAGSGPIAIKVSEKQLIDSEILAKPYFKFIDNPQPAGVSRTTNWRVAYDKGIVENQIRNRLIVLESLQAKKFNVPNLILVQRKEHGKKLQEELEKEGLKSLFIFGETEKVDRENALDKLSAGEIDTLIGSTILDVGVDVPAIGQIILAGGGKAEVNLRQRIGRGLRAKKEKANITFVIDFKDRFNKYLCTHSETRKQIIEATPGFCENIVPFFDYEKLLKI